jgi:hypothetical protein
VFTVSADRRRAACGGQVGSRRGVRYGALLTAGCEIFIGGGGALRLRQSAEFVGSRDQRGRSTVSVAGGQLRACIRSSHRPQSGKHSYHLTRGGQIGAKPADSGLKPSQAGP